MLVSAQRNSPWRAGELEAGSMTPLLTKVNRPFCFCVKAAGVMTRLAGFADSSDFGTGRVTKRARANHRDVTKTVELYAKREDDCRCAADSLSSGAENGENQYRK